MLAAATVAATLTLLIFAPGARSENFGSLLNQAPGIGPCVSTVPAPGDNTCTITVVSFTSAYSNFWWSFPGQGNQVIVRWRVRSGTAPTDYSLTPRALTFPYPDTSAFTGGARGTERIIPAGGGTFEFNERLRFAPTQNLGVDVRSPHATSDLTSIIPTGPAILYNGSGSVGLVVAFSPRLESGETRALATAQQFAPAMVQVNAETEPDVDNDGWGDVTQDACVGSVISTCALPPIPIIRNLDMARGIISFRLSQAADVNLSLYRRVRPRRYKRVSNVKLSGIKGKNKVRLSTLFDDEIDHAGRYLIKLRAINDAGKASRTKRVAFRVND